MRRAGVRSSVDQILDQKRRSLYDYARERARQSAAEPRGEDALHWLVISSYGCRAVAKSKGLSDVDAEEAVCLLVRTFAIESGINVLYATRKAR